MAFDRGQWRYVGTKGHLDSKLDFPDSNLSNSGFQGYESSNNSYLSKCPLCGKKQPIQRSTCISCSYDFNKRNDGLERFMDNVKNQKVDIPLNLIQQLSKNRFFNAPYIVRNFSSFVDKFETLINSKSKDNKILVVSKNEKLMSCLKKTLSNDSNNVILNLTDGAGNYLSSLIESINKFQELLNSSEFLLKKFENIESSKNISDLKFLAGNVHYINNKDAEVLNDFIKSYWKFWEFKHSNDVDLEFEEKNVENEILNQTKKIITVKDSISWFNKKIEKLTKLYDLLGINCEDVSDKLESMEIILMLKNAPYMIDVNKEEKFINQLKYYQKENLYDKPVSDLIKNFDYGDVLQVVDAYMKYCDENSVDQINQSILSLKNQFKSYGFNINKLNLYYSLKEEISNFSNLVYLDNNDSLLIDKLEEYIKNYHDSFKEVIHTDKNKLLKNLSDDNKYDVEDIKELNKHLININLLLSQMGINSNIISEIKKLESFCNYNFDFETNYKMIPSLENTTSKLGNTSTINDYVKNLQKELKEIVFNIFSNLEYDTNKNFELEYIHQNYSIIQKIIKKMGLSVRYISDLQKEFENISKLSKYSFKSINLNDLNENKRLFTDNTLNYINENNESQILYDLNILNISMESIIYEYTINENYLYLNDLSNIVNASNYKIDSESLDLINEIKSFFNQDNFEYLINNYSKMFGYINNLIENCNLTEYYDELDEFHEKFNEIYQIYDSCPKDNLDDLINDSKNYLLKLKKSYLNYKRLIEFKEQNILSEITINLIKNHQFSNYFEELSNIISSIEPLLSRNNFNNLNLDELLDKTNNILSNDLKLKNEFRESSSRIKNINSVNFYEILSDIKSYSIFKENRYFNNALDDFELINEILNLYSNLKIYNYENLIDLSYDELKTFLEFLKSSYKFTSYVDQGIIDKNQFIDFSSELGIIDLKIKNIKEQLADLNLSPDILENFSQIRIKNTRKIKRVLKKIEDNLKFNFNDVNNSFKSIKLIVNESYSLCINYPIELKYDNQSINSKEYAIKLLELKNTLKNYDKILKIENNILNYNDIINNNLFNIWEGFFTDLKVIKEKFKIDEKFTELYNNGIFTNETVPNLNLISDEDFDFVKDLMKIFSDNQLKSHYVLTYNNQDILMNEINNLESYDKTNYIGYRKSFENLNIIFRNSEIEECIHLLDYYIKKEDNDEIVNPYRNDLDQYLLIYNKYFDKTEFDLSIDEVLMKLNLDIKCTDLINENIIQESFLEKIKSDKTNFLNEVEQLETLQDEILAKIENFSQIYVGNVSINSRTDFFTIKKFKKDLDNVNIYLSDDDYMKNNFKDYVSYFDYVICDYSLLSDDLKYYLFLSSKKSLSIIKCEGL